MKSLKLFLASFLMLAFTQVMAQEKTEKIKVAGECGMCKKKIEKAAKTAGASFAEWDKSAKMLTVKYADAADKSKIEHAVAKAGYDTENVKATDAAYADLDDCCKYERKSSAKMEKCSNCTEACMKDGKCTHPEKDCCKKKADGKSCCSKA